MSRSVEQLKEGKLTFSAAYELSGMSKEDQEEMLKAHEEGEAPTWKEVREAKRPEPEDVSESDTLPGQMEYTKDYEKPEDEEESDQEEEQEQEEAWEQAHPESITSLCYSCQRYADCNVKTGTCENCDQYVNKAEAEKTDEQRYDEEQAAIDKETARKLREQEQEEKMNNLPSDSKEEKEYIRLSTDTFEDVIAGRRPYLILKNDKIRTGMIVSALEFMQGRATGRELTLEIVCMDDAGTSSALEDGYCVVGIRQQEIPKEAGADAAEHFHLIETARKAVRMAGLEPVEVPVRGGTDGATLSWNGLPCPNLGTGGFNFHGVCECTTVERMDRCTEIVLNIISLYAE